MCSCSSETAIVVGICGHSICFCRLPTLGANKNCPDCQMEGSFLRGAKNYLAEEMLQYVAKPRTVQEEENFSKILMENVLETEAELAELKEEHRRLITVAEKLRERGQREPARQVRVPRLWRQEERERREWLEREEEEMLRQQEERNLWLQQHREWIAQTEETLREVEWNMEQGRRDQERQERELERHQREQEQNELFHRQCEERLAQYDEHLEGIRREFGQDQRQRPPGAHRADFTAREDVPAPRIMGQRFHRIGRSGRAPRR